MLEALSKIIKGEEGRAPATAKPERKGAEFAFADEAAVKAGFDATKADLLKDLENLEKLKAKAKSGAGKDTKTPVKDPVTELEAQIKAKAEKGILRNQLKGDGSDKRTLSGDALKARLTEMTYDSYKAAEDKRMKDKLAQLKVYASLDEAQKGVAIDNAGAEERLNCNQERLAAEKELTKLEKEAETAKQREAKARAEIIDLEKGIAAARRQLSKVEPEEIGELAAKIETQAAKLTEKSGAIAAIAAEAAQKATLATQQEAVVAAIEAGIDERVQKARLEMQQRIELAKSQAQSVQLEKQVEEAARLAEVAAKKSADLAAQLQQTKAKVEELDKIVPKPVQIEKATKEVVASVKLAAQGSGQVVASVDAVEKQAESVSKAASSVADSTAIATAAAFVAELPPTLSEIAAKKQEKKGFAAAFGAGTTSLADLAKLAVDSKTRPPLPPKTGTSGHAQQQQQRIEEGKGDSSRSR